MNDTEAYENPLVSRYASREMAQLWSAQHKFSAWRRLWVCLAETQRELGLRAGDGVTARITAEQVQELRHHIDDIDFEHARALERRLRHDVMAHIHTFGDACPGARDIIHLGATSCYVTDNTDLLIMREALRLLRDQLVGVIDALGTFAATWKDLPTLGFTHFQPAQLTTVGKRACLWCYDFVLDLHEIEHRLAQLKFRGAKGTTGTQASFLALFQGDHEKVKQLDRLIAQKMDFEDVYPVTGQTYSRKVDSQILDALSGVGQSASKLGTDLRLLAHRQEVEEPSEEEQVGSSAMAYKRNPMRAERMCGLARFVSTLAGSAAQTAASQWLERTLDDSVNRRLTLPQAFLGADAVLRLALNIARGLIVNRGVIERNVGAMLPFMATENILMAAVAAGGDRQQLHERIRKYSNQATARTKAGEGQNDLLKQLRADPAFGQVNLDEVLRQGQFVGRAPQQTEEFVAQEVDPLRRRYPAACGTSTSIEV